MIKIVNNGSGLSCKSCYYYNGECKDTSGCGCTYDQIYMEEIISKCKWIDEKFIPCNEFNGMISNDCEGICVCSVCREVVNKPKKDKLTIEFERRMKNKGYSVIKHNGIYVDSNTFLLHTGYLIGLDVEQKEDK